MADAAVDKRVSTNKAAIEQTNNLSLSTSTEDDLGTRPEQTELGALSPVPPPMPENIFESSTSSASSIEANNDKAAETPKMITTRSKSKGIFNLDMFNLSAIEVPTTYSQAMNDKNRYDWKLAIEEENNSMLLNEVWSYVSLPKGARALTGRWLFKIKTFPSGEIERFKARLVAKGSIKETESMCSRRSPR